MTNNAFRPAGWYPDPDIDGTERWWNGTSFTSDVRLAPIPEAQTVSAPSIPPNPPPGWYPDPAGGSQPRWWDGTGWSHYAAPSPPAPLGGYTAAPHIYAAPAVYGSTTIVNVAPRKSVGVAFLLTFFFGPLGMFYSTVVGALIMLGVLFVGGFIVGVLTFGLAWFAWGPFVWLISIIWGCVAADNQARTQVVTHTRY